MQIFTPTISPLAVNIKPAIRSGHLPQPWGQHWKERRVGTWMQGWGGGGVSGANHRGGEEERRRGEGPIHEIGSSEPLI